MSTSKRLNLADQVDQLREEIQIPNIPLPQRPPVERPAPIAVVPPPAELPNGEKPNEGREVGSEMSVVEAVMPAVSLESRAVTRKPASRKSAFAGVAPGIESLVSDRPQLANLSCRIPQHVREELDSQVHQLKARGARIKMEDIVTAALERFLGLAPSK
jgi:hypothetical protein